MAFTNYYEVERPHSFDRLIPIPLAGFSKGFRKSTIDRFKNREMKTTIFNNSPKVQTRFSGSTSSSNSVIPNLCGNPLPSRRYKDEPSYRSASAAEMQVYETNKLSVYDLLDIINSSITTVSDLPHISIDAEASAEVDAYMESILRSKATRVIIPK